MSARKRRLAAVALVLLAVLALFGWLSRPPRPRYAVTDLGVLPGAVMSRASGINSQGDVVGLSGGEGVDMRHAFLYRGGVMTDLGLSGLISSHDGPAINDGGQIAGVMRVAASQSQSVNASGRHYHAFFYGAGGMRDLGTPPGCSMSMGSGINGQGEVICEAWGHKPGAGIYMDHAFTVAASLWTSASYQAARTQRLQGSARRSRSLATAGNGTIPGSRRSSTMAGREK